jgi:hypothetical protein
MDCTEYEKMEEIHSQTGTQQGDLVSFLKSREIHRQKDRQISR